MITTAELLAQRAKEKEHVERERPRLVGDEFAKLVKQLTGLSQCPQRCKATAKKMNELGAVGCRENVDDLAKEVHGNVSAMGWTESFRVAAIKAFDAIQHATNDDDIYKHYILRACEICDSGGQ